MTVLDLKRVIEPNVKIDFVKYQEYDGCYDAVKTILKRSEVDLDGEVLYIDVVNDDTIEVTI